MFKIFPNFSAQGLPSDDLFGLQMDVCQFGNNGKEGDDDGTELESISGKSGLVFLIIASRWILTTAPTKYQICG